jgi:hypothetical protein
MNELQMVEGKAGQKDGRQSGTGGPLAWLVTADGKWKKVPAPWGAGDPFEWLSGRRVQAIAKPHRLPVRTDGAALTIWLLSGPPATDGRAMFAAEFRGQTVATLFKGDEGVSVRGVAGIALLEGFAALPGLYRVVSLLARAPWDVPDLVCSGGHED